MRHVNKKQSIRGAGKKGGSPKPQPAILHPPKLGGFKSVASFSVAEIVDLISDGPIEGLVDQNGQLLGTDIFKGVYLDNTPIQNTQALIDQVKFNVSASISTFANAVARIWTEPNGTLKTADGRQRLLFGSHRLPDSQPTASFGAYKTYFYFQFLPGFSVGLLSSPTKWILANNKIEIHRTNPIDNGSVIFTSFEVFVKSISNTYPPTHGSKPIADENLTNLEKIKSLMRESAYGFTNSGEKAVCFIIIDLGEIFMSGIKGLRGDQRISFSISGIPNEYVNVFAQPEISGNAYTGKVRSLLVLYVPMEEESSTVYTSKGPYYYYYMPTNLLTALNSADIKLQAYEKFNIFNTSNQFFNFSNVSCQFKKGEELQTSLNNFDKVFNDYTYDFRLYGPFDKTKNIQRIILDSNFVNGAKNMSLSLFQAGLLRGDEGSIDSRPPADNYSNWNDENEKRNYDALSVTHIIENPFVDSVSATIVVNALSDTVETDVNLGGTIGKLQAGTKIPSVVAIRIETGKITDGKRLSVKLYSYSIAGLIEGQCAIDFGSNVIEAENLLKDSVQIIEADNLINAPLTQPFVLPALVDDEEPSSTKRYIKIVKLSAETNSVLINKDLALAKVTEIIDQKFSYPFSAIAGVKLDARSFGSIPERSYDCKLKKSEYLLTTKLKILRLLSTFGMSAA